MTIKIWRDGDDGRVGPFRAKDDAMTSSKVYGRWAATGQFIDLFILLKTITFSRAFIIVIRLIWFSIQFVCGWVGTFFLLFPFGLCVVFFGKCYVAIVLCCHYLWKSKEVVKIEISLFVSLYVNINKLFHSELRSRSILAKLYHPIN